MSLSDFVPSPARDAAHCRVTTSTAEHDLERLKIWSTGYRALAMRRLPEWNEDQLRAWAWAPCGTTGPARVRVPTPPVQVLGHAWVRFALEQPDEVHLRLSRLALWRRPAVWRMAIARPARRRLLALTSPPDMAATCLDGPLPPQALEFEPVDWACVGLHDWAQLLPRGALSVFRCVRWTLPRERAGLACRLAAASATLCAPEPALLTVSG